jgi:xanthine/uracil permease
VMLIGFNLAPVVANIYWPQDQWVALLTMLAVMGMAVGFRGFLGRIAVFLGLVFGYVLSWLFDRAFGQITAFDAAAGKVTTHFRVNWAGVRAADWLGFPAKTTVGPDGKELPGWHLPDIKLTFVLLVLPAVIALIAENTGSTPPPPTTWPPWWRSCSASRPSSARSSRPPRAACSAASRWSCTA